MYSLHDRKEKRGLETPSLLSESRSVYGLLPVGKGQAACGLNEVFAGEVVLTAATLFFAVGFLLAFLGAAFFMGDFAADVFLAGDFLAAFFDATFFTAFLAVVFFAAGFLETAFFATDFFAALFFAGPFFAAARFTAAFLAGAFLAAIFFIGDFLAEIFFAVAISFSLIKVAKEPSNLFGRGLMAIHRPRSTQEGRLDTLNFLS